MVKLAFLACFIAPVALFACEEDVCSQPGACCDGDCTFGVGGNTDGTTAATSVSNSAGRSGSTTSTVATSSNATAGIPAGPSSGSGMADAEVNLTFAGECAPDFSGMLVVASNADSVAVTATTVFSSVQLALESSGTIQLSTAQRVANGDVINVVSQGTTWTNISSDDPDPISGALVVNDYQEQAGIFDVDFQAVVLQNVANGSLCTVDGSLRAFGTSF